jgi:hypothetical protein
MKGSSAERSLYPDDLLGVMGMYQAAGAPVVAVGGIGSFEEWERNVRQLEFWLGVQGALPFVAVECRRSRCIKRDSGPF